MHAATVVWRRLNELAAPGITEAEKVLLQRASETSQDPNAFLRQCKGVLHVGANLGQERELYAHFGLPVVWFEPLPAISNELKLNLAEYPNQIAIQALLSNLDDEVYTLNVANNSGASSSIFALKYHTDIWPDVHYIDKLTLKSSPLASVLASNNINTSLYDALIIDTQGSELLILQGSGRVLGQIRFVKTEAADFEAYENCATVDSIQRFLSQKGFRLIRKDKFAEHPRLGAYYDMLFERVSIG